MARDFFFSMGGYTPLNTNKTWNHVNFVDTVAVLDVVDSAGSATAIDFQWTAGPTAQSTSGVNAVGSGDAAWVDEAGISRDFIYSAEGNTGTLRLSGLDPSKTYDFEVFTSWASVGTRRIEISFDGFATVDGGPLNASQNSTAVIRVAGVSPDGSGNIDLSFRSTSTDSFAHFNAMWVHENDAIVGPDITDVDTDEVITEGQTGIAVTGTNMGTTNADRVFTLRQGTVSVTQTETGTGTATAATLSAVIDSTTDIKFGAATLRCTRTADSAFDDIAVTVNPATGELFVDLTSIEDTADNRITAIPDLAVGDQLHARGEGGGAAPAGLQLNADATFEFSAGNTPQDFEVRAWDASDSTWGAFAVQSVGGGVDGTLAATLEAATTSGVGTVEISGTSASALAALASEGAGNVNIESTLEATLAALTLEAADSGEIEGTVDAQFGPATLESAGSVNILGDLDKTLSSASGESQGAVSIEGTLAETMDSATVESAAVFSMEGTLAVTLAAAFLFYESAAGAITSIFSAIARTIATKIGFKIPDNLAD